MTIIPQPNRLIVFYDGGCPLCRREIAHYQRLDRHSDIEWTDIHAHADLLKPYGVDWETAMQRFHVLGMDGRMLSGAYAFAAMWERLPYYRILALIVSFPGILWLLDGAYRQFASWRWKRICTEACAIQQTTGENST